MDGKLSRGKQESSIQDRNQEEMEEGHFHSLDDTVEDFRLPINHRPTENLDTHDLEQASLDTQLTSANVGYRLLQKMGWKGKGLGKDEQGIVEPIKAGMRDPKLGVGKQEQDDFFTAEENIQRRKLEIEVEETEDLVKKRERFKEMKEMHGSSSRDERQKREQLRQEKEMAKFAQMADAHKQQQQEISGASPDTATHNGSALVQDQRQALKFGFSSRLGTSKNMGTKAVKKPKVPAKVSSIFSNDSDEGS